MALDWGHIDNWKVFQRLVNHLFALECNSPGFIPASPYIGADGGWDGRYEGTYPPENNKGKWSIESKWTKHSFKQAVQHLRQEVHKSLTKAKRNKAQHLRIATNAELKPGQVATLEALNKGQVKSLVVWHREALAFRIERQPFLRMFFFGKAQLPKFVPWSVYVSEVERHLLPGDAKGVKTFDTYLSKSRAFIASATHNILIVEAHGGLGKSHLLRSIGQIAHAANPTRQPWFMRPGHRSVEEAIQNELIADRRYLLLVDDADRRLDEVRALVPMVMHAGNRIKLILSSRTAGQFTINEILADARRQDVVEHLRILEWEKEDLLRLLRHAAGQDRVKGEEGIVAAYRNPYVIAWIGKSISKPQAVDISSLRQRLLTDTERDTKNCLHAVSGAPDARTLLLNLACVVPFHKHDGNVARALAETCGIDQDKIPVVLQAMQSAGVVRAVGGKIRFDPDMKGDLILAEALKTWSSQEMQTILDCYMATSAEQLLINIEAAARYGSSSVVRDTLANLVRSWTRQAGETPTDVRRVRLGHVQHLCALLPEECADLIGEYLDLEVQRPSGQGSHKKREAAVLSTDAYGPAIQGLIGTHKHRRDLLGIIERLAALDLPGTYSNYKCDTLVRSLVSPLENPLPVVLETLGLMSGWLSDPNPTRVELLKHALTEVLAGAHCYNESDFTGISFGQRALRDVPEVRTLRDSAMSILGQMLDHSSLPVQQAGVDVASSHGRTTGGPPIQGPLPLAQKIAAEREQLVRQLGDVMLSTSQYSLRSPIESVLLHWWASREGVAVQAARYLSRLPRPAEYLVFRHFVDPDDVVEDFGPFRKAAPRKGRWDWYVNKTMMKAYKRTLDDFRHLATALSKKHGTPKAVVGYLQGLDKMVSPYQPWAHPPVVTCWAKRRRALFRQIRAKRSLWRQVPQRFQLEIDTTLAVTDRSHIRTLANEVAKSPSTAPLPKVEGFLRILARTRMPRSQIDKWLKQLIHKGGPKVRNLVAFQAHFIFERFKSAEHEVEMLRELVSKQRDISVMAYNLVFSLHGLQGRLANVPKQLLSGFRRMLRSRLMRVEVFGHEADRIAEFCCTTIGETCDLLQQRVDESERRWKAGQRASSYEAVPYTGLQTVRQQTQSFENFCIFVDWLVDQQGRKYLAAESDLAKVARSLFDDRNQRRTQAFDYLRRYIVARLSANALDQALSACQYLPLDADDFDLILSVVSAAHQAGKSKEAEMLLRGLTLPDGGWTSAPGEPPPELVRRKKAFEAMAERASLGGLRSMLRDCVSALAHQIDYLCRLDEESLHPRG